MSTLSNIFAADDTSADGADIAPPPPEDLTDDGTPPPPAPPPEPKGEDDPQGAPVAEDSHDFGGM